MMGVGVLMGITSGYDSRPEVVDVPIAIGGENGTPCGPQSDQCRVENEDGQQTIFVCPEHKRPPVWGDGDLPAGWLETFGNGNDSRMNYMQSQAITELAKRLRVLEINQYMPDPNEVK